MKRRVSEGPITVTSSPSWEWADSGHSGSGWYTDSGSYGAGSYDSDGQGSFCMLTGDSGYDEYYGDVVG